MFLFYALTGPDSVLFLDFCLQVVTIGIFYVFCWALCFILILNPYANLFLKIHMNREIA